MKKVKAHTSITIGSTWKLNDGARVIVWSHDDPQRARDGVGPAVVEVLEDGEPTVTVISRERLFGNIYYSVITSRGLIGHVADISMHASMTRIDDVTHLE